MYCVRRLVVLSLYLSVSVSERPEKKDPEKIRVRLDGRFRGEHLKAIERVLKRLVGVKSVNLSSMKGHAIVEVTSDKVRSCHLVDAIETVRGPGWHCTAEQISETGKLYSLEERKPALPEHLPNQIARARVQIALK